MLDTESAERIISDEVDAVGRNSSQIMRENRCAACHVLFTIKDRMGLSEADAADLLTEALLANLGPNDLFIQTVKKYKYVLCRCLH